MRPGLCSSLGRRRPTHSATAGPPGRLALSRRCFSEVPPAPGCDPAQCSADGTAHELPRGPALVPPRDVHTHRDSRLWSSLQDPELALTRGRRRRAEGSVEPVLHRELTQAVWTTPSQRTRGSRARQAHREPRPERFIRSGRSAHARCFLPIRTIHARLCLLFPRGAGLENSGPSP